MLKAIVAHDNAAINPFDEFTPAELDEYNSWSDEVTSDITDDELEDMYQQEEAYRKRLYQSAKFKFDTLHVFSQPDSLSRRGEMLILRRKLSIHQAVKSWNAIDEWKETLTYLFKHGVTICRTDVDIDHNLRIWFLLDVAYGLQDADYVPFDDELDALPHNAVAIKANWVEVEVA